MDFSNFGYNIALLIGFVTFLIGVSATLRPKAMAIKFGISAEEPALPYVISTGIRDVFMGLTILILFYLQEWTALGAIHLAISIVALSDFRVVWKFGDRKASYVHLFGAIAVFIYGVWLLQ